jgi:hypothetical protein
VTPGQDPIVGDVTPAPAGAGAGGVSGFTRKLARAGLRGPRWAVAALTGAALLVGAAPASVGPFAVYRDGPPPGWSGGFGESTCQGCHSEMQLNEAPGRVVIEGVPERYTGGQVYPVTVTLTRPGMSVGGFELTARYQDGGAQAGTLSVPPDAQGRIAVIIDRDVQYAYQRQAGSELVAPGTARWTVLWTAPAGGDGVQFNVAANAANQDDSTSGDYIYTAVEKADPAAG